MSEHQGPYVGPRPFETEDRKFFFGRDLEANEVVSLVTAHPAVLLYSQSGAGKTSLLKAGVIPLLAEEEGFDVLPPARVRERCAVNGQADRVNNIYVFNALVSVAGGADTECARLEELAGATLRGFLEARARAAGRAEVQVPTVLVFDQFEELFTSYPERWEERRGFFEQVRDALEWSPLLRVIFSMREDFIAELDPYASLLPEKLRTRFRMELLRKRTALCAVTKPLAAETAEARRRFADGVAEELVDNLLRIRVKSKGEVVEVPGEFVEPLQLQVVCRALWRSLKPGARIITKRHLKTYGDVDQALTSFYEEAVNATIEKTGVREGVLRRRLERALITPTGTRAIVFRGESETGGIPNEVMGELENQRLVRVELRGGAQWYELTHDRLIGTIKTANQRWLIGRSGAEQTRQRLETQATEWCNGGRAEASLLDDAELLEAERWVTSPEAVELGPSNSLRELLKASRASLDAKSLKAAEEQRRVEERARVARRLQWLTALLMVVSAVAVSAVWYAVRQKAQAVEVREQVFKSEKERKEAELLAEKQELDAAEARQSAEAAQRLAASAEAGRVAGQLHGEAQALLQSGNYEGARAKYNELLELYQQRKEASGQGSMWRRLAEIYHEEMNYDAAASAYKQAVRYKAMAAGKRSPEVGILYGRLAALYYEWGPQHDGDAMDTVKLALDIFGRAGFKKNRAPTNRAIETQERIMERRRAIALAAQESDR